MEAAQLDFFSQIVPPPTSRPVTPEQKLAWLAEQTRYHLMPQYERLEMLKDLTKRKTFNNESHKLDKS